MGKQESGGFWEVGRRFWEEWWLAVEVRGKVRGESMVARVYYQKLVLSVFFPGRGKTTNSSQL